MEFWGVEVKPNESLKVPVDYMKLLHISQVALGEVKSGKDVKSVPVKVSINDKKFMIGTLSSAGAPQIIFDLVFEKDLELSHGWKDGSVYFCGYIADAPDMDADEFDMSDSDEEEEDALTFNENGAFNGKPKASLKEAMEVDKDDSEDDDSDDSDSDGDGDDSEDDDESEEEEQKKDEVPKKAAKRPAEAAPKTPVSAKKAKQNTPQKAKSDTPPQKTGGKKGGHTATPHPNSKPNFKKNKKSGNRS